MKTKSVESGRTMFSFNHITPDPNREIIYLLGNDIDGLTKCQMVTGRYKPDHIDFSKDYGGLFKYVTYWMYV